MNKKGIELSLNFIVILIISIVIFSFGIYIASKIFGVGEQIQDDISAQEEKELESILMNGRYKVVLPIETKDSKRGESGIFGLGVYNNLGSEQTFTVRVEAGPLYKEDRSKEEAPSPGILFDTEIKRVIKNNNYEIFRVPFEVPDTAAKGKYQLKATVRDQNGQQYDMIQLLYVNVI